MGLLQAIFDRLSGKTNVEPTIAIAIADDGTGDPIDAGKPTPLRADPTTGALLVSAPTTGAGTLVTIRPSTASSSSVYESGRVLKASAGTFRRLRVEVSAALASNTYYLQLLTASASVPADGAVTFLRSPVAIAHTNGTASHAEIDEGDAGIEFTVGCTACISSTQLTKTAVASAAFFDGSVV
jgi:hypothetical protein